MGYTFEDFVFCVLSILLTGLIYAFVKLIRESERRRKDVITPPWGKRGRR